MRPLVKLAMGLAVVAGWIGISGCSEHHHDGVAVVPEDGGYYDGGYYGPEYYRYEGDHGRFHRGEEFREHREGFEHRGEFEHHDGFERGGGFEHGGAAHPESFGGGHEGHEGGGHGGGHR